MDNGSDAKSLVAKLTEEKNAAIQQGNKLRQELELLKGKKKGGVSITLVIIIGLLGIVMGYLMNMT